MIHWDPVQQEKIELVAAKHGISVQQAKGIMDFYLQNGARHVRNYEPYVMVNMGVYYLDPRKTNDKLRAIILKYRMGDITLEKAIKDIRIWWPVHQKARTHMPLTGKRYRRSIWRYGSNWGIYRKSVPGSTWGPNKKQHGQEQETQKD